MTEWHRQFEIIAPLHAARTSQRDVPTTLHIRAVPARSTSLGRGGLGNYKVFTPDEPLRTGTARGLAVAFSRCAPIAMGDHGGPWRLQEFVGSNHGAWESE